MANVTGLSPSCSISTKNRHTCNLSILHNHNVLTDLIADFQIFFQKEILWKDFPQKAYGRWFEFLKGHEYRQVFRGKLSKVILSSDFDSISNRRISPIDCCCCEGSFFFLLSVTHKSQAVWLISDANYLQNSSFSVLLNRQLFLVANCQAYGLPVWSIKIEFINSARNFDNQSC